MYYSVRKRESYISITSCWYRIKTPILKLYYYCNSRLIKHCYSYYDDDNCLTSFSTASLSLIIRFHAGSSCEKISIGKCETIGISRFC